MKQDRELQHCLACFMNGLVTGRLGYTRRLLSLFRKGNQFSGSLFLSAKIHYRALCSSAGNESEKLFFQLKTGLGMLLYLIRFHPFDPSNPCSIYKYISLARFVNSSLPDTFILPQMNADELRFSIVSHGKSKNTIIVRPKAAQSSSAA